MALPNIPLPIVILMGALASYVSMLFITPHPLLQSPSLPLSLSPNLPFLLNPSTVTIPASTPTSPIYLPPSEVHSSGSLFYFTNDMLLSHTVGSGPILLGVSVVIPTAATPDCTFDPGSFTAIIEDIGTNANTHDAPLSSSSIYNDYSAPTPSLYIAGCGRIVRYNPRVSGVLMPMLTESHGRTTSLTLDSYGALLVTSGGEESAIMYYPNIVNVPDVTQYKERKDKFEPVTDRPLTVIAALKDIAKELGIAGDDLEIAASKLDCSDELYYVLITSKAKSYLVSFVYDPLSFTLTEGTLLGIVEGLERGVRAGLEIEAGGDVWIAAGQLCRWKSGGEMECTTLLNGGHEEALVGLGFDSRRGRGELYFVFEGGAVGKVGVAGSKGRRECLDLVR